MVRALVGCGGFSAADGNGEYPGGGGTGGVFCSMNPALDHREYTCVGSLAGGVVRDGGRPAEGDRATGLLDVMLGKAVSRNENAARLLHCHLSPLCCRTNQF